MSVDNYNTIPGYDPRMKIESLVFNVSGLNRGEDEEEDYESLPLD